MGRAGHRFMLRARHGFSYYSVVLLMVVVVTLAWILR